ncbi:hypothetical protein [Streptomyces mirabilis]|uniref:hypothetical protein n=1 Tax=Streptomyces mirabilis TaxID=68239 RepID=UPI0022587DB0|nr:hypothetical protein [Streptomyces mirabilis]MCX4617939.1 hypothetical protein [Streptomyces mirabilis]
MSEQGERSREVWDQDGALLGEQAGAACADVLGGGRGEGRHRGRLRSAETSAVCIAASAWSRASMRITVVAPYGASMANIRDDLAAFKTGWIKQVYANRLTTAQ